MTNQLSQIVAPLSAVSRRSFESVASVNEAIR